jgi:hypothetical protein
MRARSTTIWVFAVVVMMAKMPRMSSSGARQPYRLERQRVSTPGRRCSPWVRGQQSVTAFRQFDPDRLAIDVDPDNKAGIDRILPDGKPGAGRSPGVHHVNVVARSSRKPGKEVNRQWGKDVGHDAFPGDTISLATC